MWFNVVTCVWNATTFAGRDRFIFRVWSIQAAIVPVSEHGINKAALFFKQTVCVWKKTQNGPYRKFKRIFSYPSLFSIIEKSSWNLKDSDLIRLGCQQD